MDLAAAVQTAWEHYPGVAAARAAAAQAAAAVGVARAAWLPNAGFAAQWDRATDNATLGLSFPSPLPGISGTVPPSDYSQQSAWTSAAGLYFSWEVADFGRRGANLRYYRELAAAADDRAGEVRLEVGAHAADAYLTALAAGEQIRVEQKDVARWREIAATIEALVNQQLRPGADASRAQAELAGARIRLSQAERDQAVARASLAEALGLAPGQPLPTLAGPPGANAPSGLAASTVEAPQLRIAADAVLATQARQSELARAALPRWYVLGSAYGRGSGVLAPGQFAPGLNGLAPTTAGNWAAGLGVDFSFTRWSATRAQKAQAAAQLAQDRARQQQVTAALAAARQRAAADRQAAQAIALQSPIALRAAREGEAQARVRYQTGLTGVVDLANAEELLARADSDNALSQLQIWRALVETAFAEGDLQPLLHSLSSH